eukprot:2746172-Amphidinium_carterae.1
MRMTGHSRLEPSIGDLVGVMIPQADKKPAVRAPSTTSTATAVQAKRSGTLVIDLSDRDEPQQPQQPAKKKQRKVARERELAVQKTL